MESLLFNAAFGLYVVGLFHSGAAYLSRRAVFYRVAFASVASAFVLHSLFLVQRGFERSFPAPIGQRESLAFFAWTVSLCFLFAYKRYRVPALGLFLLPLVTALMLGTTLIQSSPIPDILRSSWLYLHMTFIFLAYGMFFITFLAGLLYLIEERALKTKKPRSMTFGLPSLGALDQLFFTFLITGFLFMTMGLLVGVIWAERAWLQGWQRDPKVIASFTTWVVYLVLIYFRTTAGWRGRKAAWLSMLGFVCVLFTYLGTSFFSLQHSF